MNHTFPFPGHAMHLPDIVRAENCTLFDAEGRQYTDLESGVWCTSIGHGHPAIKAAISRQMDAISHVGFCYSSQVVEDAAETFLTLLNHQEGRCAFLCSGSEAIEYGIRTIRAIASRSKIMTMSDSYFGAYGDAAARNADDWFIFDWFDCEGCKETACTKDCPRWKSIPFDQIEAFLFEPGSSSGLVRFPPPQLIASLATTLHAQDGLLIMNEVTTGIGRTGKWFGHQHYDIQPDIVAMGKGVGNGYPVSVTSMNARVIERLDGKPIAYGQSHLNDPLGAVVAQTVIQTILDEKLIERAASLSPVLLNGLNEIAAESPLIKAVRGRGLMAVIELAGDDKWSADFHRKLIENGFIVALRPGSSVLRIDPALTIEEKELHAFLDCLKKLLNNDA